MDVAVSVVGGETHHVELTDATYADLLRVVGFHPEEAAVLVDGRPVPDDRPVDRSSVQVVRLITGG